jgi:peptide/nickel transport system substrate-binding protein
LRKENQRLKRKAVLEMTLTLLLASILTLSPISVSTGEERGPEIDKLRFKVIKELDDQVLGMQTGEINVLTEPMKMEDIDSLGADGFTITSAPAFQMAYMIFNIRPNRDYLPPGTPECNPKAAQVLSDVNFRHACFHAYDQEGICASIYGYTVTPIQSIVPPAQAVWLNPMIPKHLYNPGDPTATTEYPEDHSSCGILRYGGYVYSATLQNWVTPYDIDEDGTPGTNHPSRPLEILDPDDVVPEITVITPDATTHPSEWIHALRWVEKLQEIGLNDIDLDLRECSWDVRKYAPLYFGDFDILWWSQTLERFPTHVYDMCHSSQDTGMHLGVFTPNIAGVNNSEVDQKVETVKFSLDEAERRIACHETQYLMFDDNNPQALAYMPLYSRLHFDAFDPYLRGIVNSPGYGSDNTWTHLNIRWEPGYERIEDGETILVWCLGDEPPSLNPLNATNSNSWKILDSITDGLLTTNPYSHEDVPWLAWNWTIEAPINTTVTLDSDWYLGEGVLYKSAGETHEIIDGMTVTFSLNDTVEWQCGNPYNASDAEFNWEFLRNNQIPKYTSFWKHIIDAQIIDSHKVKIYLNVTGQFLQYDLGSTAAMLPPPVWKPLDGKPIDEILEYQPSTNTTKPTGAGPKFGTAECPTQLYATGAFVFEHYNSTEMIADLHANRDYFKTNAETQTQKVEMFHEIGDVNKDGYIDVFDLSTLGVSYGCFSWMPCYNPDADLNQDGLIDARDLALITWSFGEQREHPEP